MTAKTDATKGNTELKNVPAVKNAETPKIDPKKQENELRHSLTQLPSKELRICAISNCLQSVTLNLRKRRTN